MFISQSCCVFISCDISTVTVLIRGSSDPLVAVLFGNLCLHSKRTCIRPSSSVALSFDSHTWLRSGVGRGGASLWFAVFEWYKCRALVRDQRVAKRRPWQRLVVTSSNTPWVRFRPKCLSGREDERHDWSLKFVATTATLSDHASVWMSGALKLSSEITLDQPDQATAWIFARQMYTLLIHLCEGRPLAIVRGAPDHEGLEAWRLLNEWYQPKTRSRDLALLNETLAWDFGTKEQFLQRMKDWENATLEHIRTASAPLQEEVLVAVLISRSPKEVRTYCMCKCGRKRRS